MARSIRPLGSYGFSLLEVMVALAVLAISFVSLLDLRNRDIARHLHGGKLTTATLLAQERLAVWELNGPAVTAESGGAFPGFEGFTWKAQVNPTAFDSVREVRLHVSWSEEGRTEQVELSTYVYDAR